MLRFEMSDSSGPHRLEELKSKVEKMMDMMSQLLEAKSAGGGQRREEEESGGTGRGPQLQRWRRDGVAHC